MPTAKELGASTAPLESSKCDDGMSCCSSTDGGSSESEVVGETDCPAPEACYVAEYGVEPWSDGPGATRFGFNGITVPVPELCCVELVLGVLGSFGVVVVLDG